VIYKDENYNTFPNAIRLSEQELLIGFRHAPDRRAAYGSITHIDPASQAVCVRSSNGGETWDKQLQLIYSDFAYGVQDPCLNVLSDGTLLCSFDRTYSIRSVDGGKTWDEPIAIPMIGAVRGNIVELDDGTIVLPMYNQSDAGVSFLAGTKDKGNSWELYSEIPRMDNYDLVEPNLFKTDSGKLVAFIRSHKKQDGFDIEQTEACTSPLIVTESSDNGKTWSVPTITGISTPSPFHLLKLPSGNVLLSYGYRNKPYGIRARILDRECTRIDEAPESVLRTDGGGMDIGYTSSVLLGNGDILITYYYDDEQGCRHIAGTVCRENALIMEDENE